jgi:hypothetical protein
MLINAYVRDFITSNWGRQLQGDVVTRHLTKETKRGKGVKGCVARLDDPTSICFFDLAHTTTKKPLYNIAMRHSTTPSPLILGPAPSRTSRHWAYWRVANILRQNLRDTSSLLGPLLQRILCRTCSPLRLRLTWGWSLLLCKIYRLLGCRFRRTCLLGRCDLMSCLLGRRCLRSSLLDLWWLGGYLPNRRCFSSGLLARRCFGRGLPTCRSRCLLDFLGWNFGFCWHVIDIGDLALPAATSSHACNSGDW